MLRICTEATLISGWRRCRDLQERLMRMLLGKADGEFGPGMSGDFKEDYIQRIDTVLKI